MNNYATILKFSQAISYAISSIIILFMNNSLAFLTNVNLFILFIIYLAIFFLVATLTIFFLDVSLKRSTAVKRLLLGLDYIEGVWINISEGSSNNMYGILFVTYDVNTVHIQGVQFDDNYDVIASWQSELSYYINGKLLYTYKTLKSEEEDSVDIDGMSCIQFIRPPQEKFPTGYRGYYFDHVTGSGRVYFHGKKCKTHIDYRKIYDQEYIKNIIINNGDYDVRQ